MNPIWLIPGLVVLIGGALILALLRSAAEESKLLLDEIKRQRDVGTAVRGLGESVRGVGGSLRARK